MARPAKPRSEALEKGERKHRSKKENEIRVAAEKRLKLKRDNMDPPDYLTEDQKEIYNFILEELDESKLLTNLDTFILVKTAVNINRQIELIKAGNSAEGRESKEISVAVKNQLDSEFFRCCNELGLSPQARAKLSISAVKKAENDKQKTLMDVIKSVDEE